MIFNTRPHPFFSVVEQQKQLLCHTLFNARTSSVLYTAFAQMQHFGDEFAASFSAIVIGMVLIISMPKKRVFRRSDNYVTFRLANFVIFISLTLLPVL